MARGARGRRAAALALVLVGARVACAAAVEGRVPVVVPPPPPPLDDAYLRTLSGPVLPPDTARSLVWLVLDPAVPRPPGGGTETAEVAQRGFQFRPGLLVVPVGTTIRFPNLDDAYHSIFSYSETKRFDLGRYMTGETPPAVTFDRAGLVRLFCEIHEHMRGTILVVDSPFATATAPDGTFRLDGVPPGHHVLKVWLDPARTLERPVAVRAGDTVRVDVDAP